MPKFVLFSLVCAALTAPLGAAPKKGLTVFVPTVTAVGKGTISVRTGRFAGAKVTSVDGPKQGASNVETYKVGAFTTITVNGLKATLAEVKPGMRVYVTIGMDRDSARHIAATLAPPPQPKPTPPPGMTGKNAKGPRTLFDGVDPYKVIQVSANKITISQPGGSRSLSYQLGSFTTVQVNGEPGELSDLRVGMKVMVGAGMEATKAARIVASDE